MGRGQSTGTPRQSRAVPAPAPLTGCRVGCTTTGGTRTQSGMTSEITWWRLEALPPACRCGDAPCEGPPAARAGAHGSRMGLPWTCGPCGRRARRRMAPPGAGACSVCCGPADTGLEELMRVAGTRWAIEACLAEAQGEVGLDPYTGRHWEGGYRHITRALLAHACWAVIRQQAVPQGAKGGSATRMKR